MIAKRVTYGLLVRFSVNSNFESLIYLNNIKSISAIKW